MNEEFDAKLFEAVIPESIKAKILGHIIETYALEVRDKITPWEKEEKVRNLTLAELRRNSVNPLGGERYLLVDAWQIERLSENYPSTSIAIQLATRWGIVDKVHLSTIHYSGCSALWEGPRYNLAIPNKLTWEEIVPYFRLVSRNQFDFDPNAYVEWIEHLEAEERAKDQVFDDWDWDV